MDIKHATVMHFRAFKKLNEVSPNFFFVSTLNSIFAAITPYVTVYFSSQILKEIATLRREDVLYRWVIVSTISIAFISIVGAFLKRRSQILFDDLYGRKEIVFIRKMFSLDFSELDKQENNDLRAQIQQNDQWAGWGFMKAVEIYESLLTALIGLLSGSVLTFSLFTSFVPKTAGKLVIINNPLFIFLMVVMVLGISVFAGRLTAKSLSYWNNFADDATFGNRLYGHFGFIGTRKESYVDVRMNDQEKLISAYWGSDHTFGVNGKIAKCAAKEMGIYASLGVCITTVITGAIYLFTCLKAWGGAIDVGSIMQYVGASSAMVINVFSLTALVGEANTNTSFLDKTFEFLDIPNAMYQGSLTTEKRSDRKYDVEFRDVSFKYPGSDVWALRHVNMKFKVGNRLAIVGENGSGKTTFIKLLCRLYDPQEGEILLNGIDIRKYRYDDYINIFSVVFQDFQLLSAPLAYNVAGSMRYDKDRVYRALVDAGFKERLDSMKDGLDTIIFKDFDEGGVDVSGGEAQKIAIARALYKDAPFIILDEPTAALDPIAEAEIYSKFDEIVGDKTAVYISHRLSSCKFCDEIVVFEGGNIVEQGSHEDLLKNKDGKYSKLWHAQAQYYV